MCFFLKLSNVVNLFIDEGRLSVNKKKWEKQILAKFFPAELFRTFLVLYSDSAVEGHMPQLGSHYESSADDSF